MRLRHNPLPRYATVLFFVMTVWAVGLSARAAGPLESSVTKPGNTDDGLYEIRHGDTLGAIAMANGVPLSDLMKANDITDPDKLYAGQKLLLPESSEHGTRTKDGVVITVPQGFNLSLIAAAYGVPFKTIARANKLTNPDILREGQSLLIPGATKVVELVPPPPCFKDPVELYRVRTDVTEHVSLCFCDGSPNPKGVEILSVLAGPIGAEVPFQLHPRMAQLLQQVAEAYPGKRIEIISGQRTAKQPKRESYHTKGQALDYRVAGVSNRTLSRFVRKFDKVGVGYYPNSVFIHMDTRDQQAYWIDYSGPGEKPIYGRAGMTETQVQRIRVKRRQTLVRKLDREAPSHRKRRAVANAIAEKMALPQVSDKPSS